MNNHLEPQEEVLDRAAAMDRQFAGPPRATATAPEVEKSLAKLMRGPEAQRIEISRFCGVDLDHLRIPAPEESLREFSYFRRRQAGDYVKKVGEPCINLSWLPDYLEDKNAMLQAISYLSEEEKNQYRCHLAALMAGGRYLFEATAREEAEAFLRTIKKWREVSK